MIVNAQPGPSGRSIVETGDHPNEPRGVGLARPPRFATLNSPAASSLNRGRLPYQRRKSAHLGMSFAPTPQGSMGTLEVEFFGEPSISLSL